MIGRRLLRTTKYVHGLRNTAAIKCSQRYEIACASTSASNSCRDLGRILRLCEIIEQILHVWLPHPDFQGCWYLRSLREADLLTSTIISGLQVYFDKSLGANLLYRFERPQYAEMRKRYITGPKVIIGQEKEMSAIYGAEHLLRMLGVFIWASTPPHYHLSMCRSEPSTNSSHVYDGPGIGELGSRLCERTVCVSTVLKLRLCPDSWYSSRWMVQERDRLFVRQYESASLQYQNISRS